MVQFTSLIIALAICLPFVTADRSETSTSPSRPVYGWCDFTWRNRQKVSDIQCGARDQRADGHSVFTELHLYLNNADTWKAIAFYENKDGKGTSRWDNTKHSWDTLGASYIFKAQVRTCVNGGECFLGNMVKNPYL